jgi:hypothetical protein
VNHEEDIAKTVLEYLEWLDSWDSDLKHSEQVQLGLADLLEKISNSEVSSTKTDEREPKWLRPDALLELRLKSFEWASGRKAPDWLETPTRYLQQLALKVRYVYETEQVGPMTSSLLMHLYNEISAIKDKDINSSWDKSSSNQKAFIKNAEQNQGVGYAAYGEGWQKYWDDRWLTRRKNGKGWEYSAADILDALPSHVTPPDESTVRKHRLNIQKLRDASAKK